MNENSIDYELQERPIEQSERRKLFIDSDRVQAQKLIDKSQPMHASGVQNLLLTN